MQPIRTISEIPCHIDILPTIQIPLYQNLSIEVKQLRALGMSYKVKGGSRLAPPLLK